jgi:hypothetical protein
MTSTAAIYATFDALYQHACEPDDVEIRHRRVDHFANEQAPAVEIPIRLAGGCEHAQHYVGTGWFDFKPVLSTSEQQP